MDVAYAFNFMSRGIMFQDLHVIGSHVVQFIFFVHTFYAFESPLYYDHCNHDGDVNVIPSTMGFC